MPRGQSGQQLGGWSRIGFRWCRINRRKSRRNQRFDRRSCTWSAQQVKREKKSGQLSRLFGEKGEETGMDAQSRWRITQIHQRVQNQMRIQRGRLRSWSVGHVHWSSPVLGSRFPHNFGPESCHDPGKELKDMDSEEYESYRKRKGRAQVSTVLLAEIAPGITLHMWTGAIYWLF